LVVILTKLKIVILSEAKDPAVCRPHTYAWLASLFKLHPTTSTPFERPARNPYNLELATAGRLIVAYGSYFSNERRA
jgi:hypothetical protein